MRKITLFVAGVALFVLIGIDTWLYIRTFGPGTHWLARPIRHQ